MTPDELESIKRRIAMDREALASYGVDTHYAIVDSDALVAEVERLRAALRQIHAAAARRDRVHGSESLVLLRRAIEAVLEPTATDSHQIMPPPPAPGASM